MGYIDPNQITIKNMKDMKQKKLGTNITFFFQNLSLKFKMFDKNINALSNITSQI